MLAFRSRSAVTRVRAIRGSLGVCSLLPKSNFSAAALLSQETTEETFTSNPGTEAVTPDVDPEPRIPLSIQSVWYRPFRRKAEYGLPVCDLQIRSYSVRNLEFMCDFALRAAYYLNLPASGPVPLPRRTERWTVPRGHFAHKKSQENFERVTYKRLIQIKDGHPETVEIWLAYLKKHQFYGTGMKANVWGFEELGVGKRMNVSLDNLRDVATKPKWAHSGVRKTLETAEKVAEILNSPEYRALANKTDTEEAERELLQAAPLETVKLEGASEAEVDETIQKVGEEAMKAEESKEVAEVNEVDPIVDEMAELEEPTGFGAQPIDEVKVETQTDPLGPSSMIDDIVTTSSQAAEVPKPPPVTQTQEEVLAAFTPEVIPSEAKEVTDPPQDPSSDQAEGVVATPAPAETLTAATALAVDVPEDTAPEERLVETIGATPLPPEASATDPAIGTPATGVENPSAKALGTHTLETGTQSPVMEETRHAPEIPVGGALADATKNPLPVVEEVEDISKAPAEEALLDATKNPLPVVEEVEVISKAPAEEALLDATENLSPVVEEANDTPEAPVEGGLSETIATPPPVLKEVGGVSKAPAEESLLDSTENPSPVVEEAKDTPEAQVESRLSDTPVTPPPVVEEVEAVSKAPVEETLLGNTEKTPPVVQGAKDTPEAQIEGGLSGATATSPPIAEEGKDVSDAPVEELSATPIGAAPPVSEVQPPITGEAKEISEATPTQDSCTGPSGTVAPVLEEELRPEAEPQDKAAQAAPEATRAQKAEAEVEMEVKKVAEETAAYELTREGAHDLKPEKKD